MARGAHWGSGAENSSPFPRPWEGRSARAQSARRTHPWYGTRETDKTLVSHRWACSVKPCSFVHVSWRDKRRTRNLLGVEPKPGTPRIILPPRDRPLDGLRFKVVIESWEILVRIILPQRKGRDSSILLRLGPVENLLIFVCGGHCDYGSFS